MNNKVVLEELFRMRELMGMKVLSETRNTLTRTLLMEGGKTIDQLVGVSPKSLDNLSKSGVDFANDLTKLSDEFTSRGIRSFADLSDAVAKKQGITVADVTDDMIESYIKNDDVLYKSILAKAAAASADQVDTLIKNANLTAVFSRNPGQLNVYKTYISTPPSARNVDLLISSVDDSIDEVSGLIDDIQTGKIPGVTAVPKELQDLYENLLGKKTDLEAYKNKGTSTSAYTPPPSQTTFKPLFDSDAELEKKILEDLESFKKLYPDVQGDDLLKVKNDMMQRWKGIPDEATFRGQMDRISNEIDNKLKQLQDAINRAKDEAERKKLTEQLGKTQKKSEVLKKVKEFCLGNWSGWKNAGVVDKTKMVGGALGGFSVCSLAAAVLVGEVTSHVKYFYYDNDGQYKNTFMCPIVSGLPVLGTWMCENDSETGEEGWFSKMCPDTCSQERKAQDSENDTTTDFPNTSEGYVKWVEKNHKGEYGTKYMWSDGKALYLKDASTGSWEEMTYDKGNFTE